MVTPKTYTITKRYNTMISRMSFNQSGSIASLQKKFAVSLKTEIPKYDTITCLIETLNTVATKSNSGETFEWFEGTKNV